MEDVFGRPPGAFEVTMSKTDPRPPQDEMDDSMKELLIEMEKVAVPPRLQELARRLEAAIAASKARRDG
ncbi:hypothetical protein TW83_05855 [Paracoccus sp. S4493]|jgi:hypothetical protein|nr:hypothetical protein SY26_16995 [Paracoccus sp. 228]KJZ31982.1 hypothetical protein TW83_05855 [Paracoccus sp. S4493]|tara:strand:- start:12 stop:218 length:207 start_codon:yes stop_codon:yes gene_type:complete